MARARFRLVKTEGDPAERPLPGRARRLRTAAALGQRHRFSRFAVVGIIATAVDFTVFNVMLLVLGLPGLVEVILANTVAFAVAAATGHQLNARHTFRVRPDRGSLVRYVLVAAGGLAIYNGSLAGLHVWLSPEGLLGLNAIKAAAVLGSLAWNYTGFRHFAFRGALTRPDAAEEERAA